MKSEEVKKKEELNRMKETISWFLDREESFELDVLNHDKIIKIKSVIYQERLLEILKFLKRFGQDVYFSVGSYGLEISFELEGEDE